MGTTFTDGKRCQEYFHKEPEVDKFINRVLDTHRREGQLVLNSGFQRLNACKNWSLMGCR